jgi:hypothetical protein
MGLRLLRKLKVSEDCSLARGIRFPTAAALAPGIPQAAEALKQSETLSDIISTAYKAAKVVLDITKESSSALPELNSVAGGILAIIKHVEVSHISVHWNTCSNNRFNSTASNGEQRRRSEDA